MKKQIIRITENDLRNIVKNTVKRVLRESGNDDIENGIRAAQENDDIPESEFGAIHDDDSDDYLGYLNDAHRDEEDRDIKNYLDDMEADRWVNYDDMGDASDDDLYNSRV